MESQGEFERFEQAVRLFDEATKRLPGGQGSLSNTQTTTIDAGSKFLWFGLWTATSCCIAMFLMFVFALFQISQMRINQMEDSRKLEADSDRLSILLQWAPNLRDEVNKEMKDKEKHK